MGINGYSVMCKLHVNLVIRFEVGNKKKTVGFK
jgi:hypothetical protein